jgi:hypothetical protein
MSASKASISAFLSKHKTGTSMRESSLSENKHKHTTIACMVT